MTIFTQNEPQPVQNLHETGKKGKPDLLPSEYLEFYGNKLTKAMYLSYLRCYLSIVTGTPLTELETDIDMAFLRYLTNPGTDPAGDLMNFVKLSRKSGRKLAPLTLFRYMDAGERYLRDCCCIELTTRQKLLRKKDLPVRKPVTQDAILEKKDIKAILACCDERLVLEILLGVSAGMRIGEILSFTADDIGFATRPASIRIRAENSKNGIGRTVYLSDEAEAALRAWLQVRDRITGMRGSCRKDNPFVIPYSKNNEIYRLNLRLKKAGYDGRDPVTGFHKVHFHSFRKYFLTQFKLAASPEVAEILAGHEGYLGRAYRRLPEKQIRDEYLKAEPYLRVFTSDTGDLAWGQTPNCISLQKTPLCLMEELTAMKAVLEQMQWDLAHLSVSMNDRNHDCRFCPNAFSPDESEKSGR